MNNNNNNNNNNEYCKELWKCRLSLGLEREQLMERNLRPEVTGCNQI